MSDYSHEERVRDDRRIWLLAVLAGLLMLLNMCTGCGGEVEYDFKTADGWKVYVNDFDLTEAEVNAASFLTMTHLVKYDPQRFSMDIMRARIKAMGPYITVEDELWSPDGKKVGGLTWSGGVQITYSPCVADTALAHEMIHYIDWQVNDQVDYQHAEKKLWQTVVYQIREALRVEFCPAN